MKDKKRKIILFSIILIIFIFLGLLGIKFFSKQNSDSNSKVSDVDAQIKKDNLEKEEPEIKENNEDNTDSDLILIKEIILDEKIELEVNKTYTLKATINPVDATNKNLTWVSSNPSVATVDANGKVTGKKSGSVTISATSQDGSNIKASIDIKVKEKAQTENSNTEQPKKEETTTSTPKVLTCEDKTKNAKNIEKVANFVKYENEEVVNTENKYGAKLITTKTLTYAIFSDVGKCLINSTSKTTLDSANFKATSKELEPEAKEVYNKYKNDLNEQLKYVNQYRSEVGVPDIVLDENLSIMATIRALEIGYANNFSHTRPDGSSCFSIFSDYNVSYRTIGENIAYGSTTAEGVSSQWRNSQYHYENMISSDFKKIGIGKAIINGRAYWVQIFLG